MSQDRSSGLDLIGWILGLAGLVLIFVGFFLVDHGGWLGPDSPAGMDGAPETAPLREPTRSEVEGKSARETESDDPMRALNRLSDVVERVPSGVNLYRLLEARPALARLLAKLLAHAPALSDQLARRPELLDGLIDASSFVEVLKAELRSIAARLVMPEFMFTSDASNATFATITSLRTMPTIGLPLSVAMGAKTRTRPSRCGTSNCQPTQSSVKPCAIRKPSPMCASVVGSRPPAARL